MVRTALRSLTIAGIVLAVVACDNVEWGGTRVSLEAPPPPDAPIGVAPDSATAEPAPPPPLPPAVYLVRRTGSTGVLQPVAEFRDGALTGWAASTDSLTVDPTEHLRRYRAERLTPGATFTLFAEGARVGRLVATDSTGVSETHCPARPLVRGRLELVPEAVQAELFVAVAERPADPAGYGGYEGLSSTRDIRVASLNLFAEAIPEVGALWPPDLLSSRADLTLYPDSGAAFPGFAATFTFRDGLSTAAPTSDAAYSAFFLAEHDGTRFRRVFTWYRPVDEGGKAVPRYLDRADADGDGRDEVYLEVFGQEERHFAGLVPGPDGWTVAFEDRCSSPDL